MCPPFDFGNRIIIPIPVTPESVQAAELFAASTSHKVWAGLLCRYLRNPELLNYLFEFEAVQDLNRILKPKSPYRPHEPVYLYGNSFCCRCGQLREGVTANFVHPVCTTCKLVPTAKLLTFCDNANRVILALPNIDKHQLESYLMEYISNASQSNSC